MEHFEIILKNEQLKFYNRLSWLIITINFIVFLYLGLFSAEKNSRVGAITSIVLLILLLMLQRFSKKINWLPGMHPYFLVLMVGWIIMGKYWLTAIPFFFDILSAISTRKLVVDVSANIIMYPSFPPQKIYWSALSSMILKDGLLTINFKNNAIIQQYADDIKTSVNEQEFNDFCRQQLKK